MLLPLCRPIAYLGNMHDLLHGIKDVPKAAEMQMDHEVLVSPQHYGLCRIPCNLLDYESLFAINSHMYYQRPLCLLN